VEAFFRTSAREKRRSREEGLRLVEKLIYAGGTIHLVGSPQVIEAAERIFYLTLQGLTQETRTEYVDELELFQAIARKDPGHPSP
jgi:hypothetical protein